MSDLKYRVLSLDGGGMRGLVTTVLLQKLTEQPDLRNFLDSVDLIAGTSTGGLIALGLAKGLSLEAIKRVYVEEGPEIFPKSQWDRMLPSLPVGGWTENLDRIRSAEYDTAPLDRTVHKMLEETKLTELTKSVLITSFDLCGIDKVGRQIWKPKLFHNLPGEDTDDIKAYKVALYTTAGPTVFPSVDGYIDGGVFGNNPSMCALAQTQDTRCYKSPPALHGAPAPGIPQVVLLSVGTGLHLKYIVGTANDWGFWQWKRHLVDVFEEGTVGIAHYQCKQLLGDRYHRLNPAFEAGKVFKTDDADPQTTKELIDIATGWANRPEGEFADAVTFLRNHWVRIGTPAGTGVAAGGV